MAHITDSENEIRRVFLPATGSHFCLVLGASVSSYDRGTGCSDGFVIFLITYTKMLEWHLNAIRDELGNLKSCHLTNQEETKSRAFFTHVFYSRIVMGIIV
jgi:hypothetical protein